MPGTEKILHYLVGPFSIPDDQLLPAPAPCMEVVTHSGERYLWGIVSPLKKDETKK